ncbi:MAG: protoheme IX farnesyltransferase [Acidobacteria bacterium]|nr:protoheme IX farnesyltransferase [Acidobacteriota bacterium]
MGSAAGTQETTRSRGADFLALTKPRLNFLVLLTTAAAYRLGVGPELAAMPLVHTLVGTALVAGGSAALNQVWERDTDKLMRRTRLRPLPDARLDPAHARAFGYALGVLGLLELALFVNVLSAAIAAITLASYIWFYTPLKFRTSLSTIVGALPGALPAVIGWSAATNTLSLEAWVLFGIVFMWQMPHFLAIAWMYRDEYARAGMPLLPVIQPDGRSTGRQAVLYTAGLIPLTLMPTLIGLSTAFYLAGAVVLGAILMVFCLEFAVTRTTDAARRLFLASILYLPGLWALLVWDHVR